MINDAVSAIVLIVAVNQLPISMVVVDKKGTIRWLATPARNSQSATARLFVLFVNCIDSMFMLFVRSTAKHDCHGVFAISLESILLKLFSGGKHPDSFSFISSYSKTIMKHIISV